MYKTRTLSTYLDKVTKAFPVLLVTGPRQVGKTTLLQHAAATNRAYVTLDDPMIRALAKEDPALFLKKYPAPLLIDEIQYAPELFSLIKIAVDKQKEPSMYWLTGSQQFHLMKHVSESLAGRIGILKLQGLSQSERCNRATLDTFLPTTEHLRRRKRDAEFNLQALYQIILRGAFPAVALNPEMESALFYNSYIQTYLQRDVRDLMRVGDEQTFLRFLKTVAARTAQLINFSEVARDADISLPTAKAWISILEASGLVYMLQPYHTNLTKRLVKAPKLYFLDTGLCAYLTGWSNAETLEAGAMSGAILETYIVSELLKSYWHCGMDAPFYFYRDRDMKEVDLLILRDGMIFPLEFKKTANPNRSAIQNFSALEKLNIPIGEGGVICLIDNILPLNEKMNAISIQYL